MAIPIFVPLVRDRAALFRDTILRILARSGPAVNELNADELRSAIAGYVPVGLLESDVPDIVEMAIQWAASDHPAIDELRFAGEALRSALADDSEAWHALAKSLTARAGLASDEQRIREIVNRSIAHHRRAVRSLAESWPCASERAEADCFHEMRSGSFVDLDDAFARISGTTREQWSGQVDGTIAAGRTGE